MEKSMDDAEKKARELMEYCSGAKWEDGVTAIAAVLREKDAELEAAREELGNEICAYAELRQQADSVPKLQAELEAVLNDYKALGNQLGREIVELRQRAEQAAEVGHLRVSLAAFLRRRQREMIECIIHHQCCRRCAEDGCSNCGECTANAILAQAE